MQQGAAGRRTLCAWGILKRESIRAGPVCLLDDQLDLCDESRAHTQCDAMTLFYYCKASIKSRRLIVVYGLFADMEMRGSRPPPPHACVAPEKFTLPYLLVADAVSARHEKSATNNRGGLARSLSRADKVQVMQNGP